MRNTKIGKFFTTLIYTVLLTIPMLSVLVRVIYVQSNHNAKDSYYGDTINETSYDFTYSLKNGNRYFLSLPKNLFVFNSTGGATNTYIVVDNLVVTGDTINDYTDVNRIGFYSSNNATSFVLYFFKVGQSSSSFSVNSSASYIYEFDYLSSSNTFATYINNNPIFYSVSYNDYSYLDNVFEYSISQVLDTYGKGNINFVNWFGSLFFTNTNQLYFNFVNMYLNYALYISACYLFYLILSWFIKFITNLIENSFLDKARKE